MGSCGCKNGMKKGSPCGCNTCRGQRSKTYSRKINGNRFIGSKIPVQRNIANAVANKIRNSGNNARVIPAKNGYRVYVDPNRKYNHPIKMMQVVPNVFNRDRNQNGIYDSVEKILMPRQYNRDIGVVRNQDIVALGLQAKNLNFNPDRTKDMIESRFGKAVSEDWIQRYAKGDGESVLDGRLADDRLVSDNLKSGGLRTNKDRNDMFYQLTDIASMPEEKQLQKLEDLIGSQSKLYRELQAVDHDIDLDDSTIRYFTYNDTEVEFTFDDLMLDGYLGAGVSNHVSNMIDTPYNDYGQGQTTSLIETTRYYEDDLKAIWEDVNKTNIERIEGWLADEIKDNEYSGMVGDQSVEDGRAEMAERLQDMMGQGFTGSWTRIKRWLKTEIEDNEKSLVSGKNLQQTDFEYGALEAAKGLLSQIQKWEMESEWIDEAINEEYDAISPMGGGGNYTLDETLKEELDPTSYWSLIRSAYMSRLRDYDRKAYNHGGGDLPTMAISSQPARTFLPLFKNSPPRKDDEMYYNSDGSKRKYVKRTINGETYYGYFVDALGRRN
jgi:hypothetical protein